MVLAYDYIVSTSIRSYLSLWYTFDQLCSTCFHTSPFGWYRFRTLNRTGCVVHFTVIGQKILTIVIFPLRLWWHIAFGIFTRFVECVFWRCWCDWWFFEWHSTDGILTAQFRRLCYSNWTWRTQRIGVGQRFGGQWFCIFEFVDIVMCSYWMVLNAGIFDTKHTIRFASIEEDIAVVETVGLEFGIAPENAAHDNNDDEKHTSGCHTPKSNL